MLVWLDSADRHLADRTPSSGWEPIFQQIASAQHPANIVA